MESATTQPRKGKYWSRQPRPAEERFWEKVDAFGDCWEWQARTSTGGYGRFDPTFGKSVQAHRFCYEALVGPIPDDRVLDHLCRNRRCVNPDHLRIVTRRQNVLVGYGPSAKNATKTHCLRGHAFDAANTWIEKNGARHCRACYCARSARRRKAGQ